MIRRTTTQVTPLLVLSVLFAIMSTKIAAHADAPTASPTASPPGLEIIGLSASEAVQVLAKRHLKPGPTFLEPDVSINEQSLEDQKLKATEGLLGRNRSGVLLFNLLNLKIQSTPAPQTSPSPSSEAFELLAPPEGYDVSTGISSEPQVESPESGRAQTVQVDLATPGDSGYQPPPDSQLSVGRDYVVQMDNSNVLVWSKTNFAGQTPTAFPLRHDQNSADSGGLFPSPTGYTVGDPWLVYDAENDRWIASAMVFDYATKSTALALAVSPIGDPRKPWSTRRLLVDGSEFSNGVLRDQPKIALGGDKLLIGWTDFDHTGRYLGGRWAVFSKSSVESSNQGLAGQGTTVPDHCLPNPIPARNETTQAHAFILAAVFPGSEAACNGLVAPSTPGTGNDIKVIELDGRPPTVSAQYVDLQVAPYSAPADIQQENGKPIFAGDTRLISAVWQDDVLWLGANGSCSVGPPGSPTRGCFRLLEVVTTPAPKIVDDVNVALSGRDLLYPSISLDQNEDVIAAVQETSGLNYVGAAVFARLAGHQDWLLQTFKNGTQPIVCTGGQKERIGDYSGADTDPQAPDIVWVSLQVSTAAGCNETTFIGLTEIK